MVWDDQGLIFTLIVNGIALAILIPLAAYCLCSRKLSTARIYRPNHTTYPEGIATHAKPTDEELLKGPTSGVWGTLMNKKYSSTFSLPSFWRLAVVGEARWEDDSVADPLPVDPQSDLMLAFLKLCALLFSVCSLLSVIWIVVIAATDDHISTNNVLKDPTDCRGKDRKECNAVLNCDMAGGFVGDAVGGCFPIKTSGLYDLSIQNVTPMSGRNYGVALLALIFGILFAICMFFMTKSVTKYSRRVMKRQLNNAIGYRTVVLTGLPVPDPKKLKKGSEEEKEMALASEDNFKAEYLSAKSYFETEQTALNFGGFLCCGRTALTQGDMSLFEGADAAGVTAKIEDIVIDKLPPDDMYDHIDEYNEARDALQDAIADEEKYHRELKADRVVAYASLAKKGRTDIPVEQELPPLMGGIFPKCCCDVAVVDYRKNDFREKTETLNADIELVDEQPCTGAVFVVLKDALSAHELVDLFNAKYGGCCALGQARIAGPYDQIERCNLAKNKFLAYLLFFLCTCLFIVLVFFWAIPVGFLGSLTSLASLPGIGPAFGALVDALPVAVLGILTAYLPVIVLAIFNIVLPIMIGAMVRAGGTMNSLETANGVMFQMYIFLVMTGVVIQAALQGGIFQLAAVIQDPTKEAIFNMIIAVVSPVGGYWYAKVIGAGCLSMWLVALLLGPIIVSKLFAKRASTQRDYDGNFIHLPFDFAVTTAFHLTIASIGMFFHVTVPLLAIFVGIYFWNAYMVYRGIFFDNFRPVAVPCQLVSNFNLMGSSMRILAVLYTIASFGTLLIMGFKHHDGASAIVALTVVIAVIVDIYVFYYSHNWQASMLRVRKWTREPMGDAGASTEPQAKESSEDAAQVAPKCVSKQQFETAAATSADPNDKMVGVPYHSRHLDLETIDAEGVIADAEKKDCSVYLVWHGEAEIKEMRRDYVKDRRSAAKDLEKEIVKDFKKNPNKNTVDQEMRETA